MQIQYSNETPIVQAETVNLALKAYLEKQNIPKNQVAQRIRISAPGLHYFLTGVNEMSISRVHEICHVLGIEIRLNGKVAIHEICETEIKSGRPISRNDVNQLEERFWQVNSDLLDQDGFDVPTFELQEYLVETKEGMTGLISGLSKTEKARLNDIAYGDSLTDKIRDMHRRNGEIVPDVYHLLQIAVRAHIRQCIDRPINDLMSANFPGGFNWDLKAAGDIPF